MLGAVIFDLDGTLVDSETQNAESLARALSQHGRHMTNEERAFVIGHGWAEIYDFVRGNGGITLELPELREAAAVEREKLVAAEGMVVLPGAVEAVRAAAARTTVALVSGSSRAEIALCLRYLQIDELLPWYVGAEDTRRGKPSPDGYLHAATHLGIPPQRCLVLEDSTAGIQAARTAGMFVVAVQAGNFANQPQDGAHLVIRDLRSVDDTFFDDVCTRMAALAGGPSAT
jgi:HAD superfamily hydrolase (TIGR01509 family)